ncbi:nuclear transport factor 2 family protein [Conyzicola sp.]|uniref:nuclear transport factor 2 family protein n=1 Tax=Conyzicola sp. TaxID=1969404 RepID=UPI0039897B28
MTDVEIVTASMAAYRTQDRDAAERIFARDFVFTSPQDDRIDRATWFEVCFPTADRFVWYELLEIVRSGTGVLSLYEYELQTGERYRNTELAVVRDGQIAEVQVFFGGQV